MEEGLLSRTVRVETVAAAAVFADSPRRRLLLSFIGRDRSLSEAAAEAAMSLARVHYHALRFVALGLLKVTGERPRAGRPVKFYRATADAFFVPDHRLPRPAQQGLAQELARAVAAAQANDEGAGLLFHLEAGRPRIRRIDGRPKRAVFETWRILELDEGAAGALSERIGALLQAAAPTPGARTRPYLLHAALAPRLRP